jgi:hypothetical protein
MPMDYSKAAKSLKPHQFLNIKDGDEVELKIIEFQDERSTQGRTLEDGTIIRPKKYYPIIVEDNEGTQFVIEGTGLLLEALEEAGAPQEGNTIVLSRKPVFKADFKTGEEKEFLGFHCEFLDKGTPIEDVVLPSEK